MLNRTLHALLLAALLATVAAGCSRKHPKSRTTKAQETLLSENSTYAVVEVTPLRGERSQGSTQGAAVRLATLVFVPETDEARRLEQERFPEDCPRSYSCFSLARERGGLQVLQASTGAFPWTADAEVGTVRRMSGGVLSFNAWTGNEVLRLSGTEAEPAEVEIRLVKRCRTRVVRVDYSSREDTNLGILKRETNVRRNWVEAHPSCLGLGDLEPVVLSPEALSAREAQEQAARAAPLTKDQVQPEAMRAWRDERFAAFQQVAEAYARERPLSPEVRETLSPAERVVNPELAGLMHAAGLRELVFESPCDIRESRGKCSEERNLLKVLWEGGDGGVMRESRYIRGRHTRRWGTMLRSLRLEPDGRLRITPAEPPSAIVSAAREMLDVWGQNTPVPELTPEVVASAAREVVTFMARDVKRWADPDKRPLPQPENWSFVNP
jgi:hypothetical protein